MRFTILGTTQAHLPDGTPVPVGGARLRALLAVLALRAGRAVPVAVLIDEVWDGAPPADAAGALQALVGRLRRALGHSVVVSADGGGYRLAAEPDDVDAHRFERLAAEGARAFAEGAPEKAAGLLGDALALWQGLALADLPGRTADAARWDALRLDARRTRLAAGLALGQADTVLPELTALCAAHPLDEPLQVLRLRALRDAGQAAEALAAYDAVRTELADRLGTDPGPELRALHTELLHPHPRPHHTAPVEGAGVRAVGNLRARLTSFVGREAEIEAIRRDLRTARLVTLLGPGGAGKTRLSQEVAERVDGVPDGVWLAELAPVEAAADPKAVPEAVLTAVGARETVLHSAGAEELRAADRRGDDPLTRLAEHCAGRRMLLLLDNCEHVVAAAAHLVEHLLARCPGLTVLATSREPLGVPGEVVRPLDPLPEPVALRLLADRGAAASPGFRVDADEATAAAAAEICHRLDGLPLAIELAAARLRMFTPRQIADRLDDRFRLLTSGSRTALPRQQTLRAVVDWSWDLLAEDERAVLCRLSVFAGGSDLAAAESVCGGASGGGAWGGSASGGGARVIDPSQVMDLLGSLVDKSLVVAAPSSQGQMRYRLLETVAEYAAERLDEAGDRAAAERAHLVHYRELARTTDPELRGPGQRAAIARIEVEYENLRTALRRATAARDEQEALCLVLSLAWYWQMRELRSESCYWATTVAELGPDPFDPPVKAAPPLHERSIDAPPPMPPEQLWEARRGVRLIQLVGMDHTSNAWLSGENKARMRRIGEAYRPGLPQTCRSPGALWIYVEMLTGDPDGLVALISETIDACRAYGYRWELAGSLQMRANVMANRTDWAAAADRDADEALGLFLELGDTWGAAEALSARGEARERRGDLARAGADFSAAIELAEELGAPTQVGILKARFAGVLLETGQAERGEAMLREVIAQQGRGVMDALPAARLYLGIWLGRTERTAEAREQLVLMRQQYPAGPVVFFEGLVRGLLGWLDNQEGRYDTALEHARAALTYSNEPLAVMIAPQLPAVHLVTVARALVGLAAADGEGAPGRVRDAARLGRVRDAARLLGAGDALLPPGHRADTLERENRAAAEAAVRAVIGDAAYERAYAQGGGLSVEEATALFADGR
ncbi:ATP-binding protein [Streptomyces apocyni]|uniref:ATP-binding protein n=1 Tax=Streptomyces apocyni TaxID=2654677 RepID=UPI0012EAD0A4|nr:BTAD domain-containing putative transcriptional regulator [Streptomyces apocyni]